MINDRFAQLIARHLSGETSEEEAKEFELLLKEDPQAHYFYELFSGYWSVGPQKTVNELQEEIHFQQIAFERRCSTGVDASADEPLGCMAATRVSM